jgi:deazaflavin-dependent oxidoreductase (nitroreductase family)
MEPDTFAEIAIDLLFTDTGDPFCGPEKLCERAEIITAARGESRQGSRLCPLFARRIFAGMNLKNGSNVVANLVTIGRKSGQPRTVELRFFYRDGKFYATSSRIQGKHWCQNMLKDPAVEIKVQGETVSCVGTQVSDEALRKEILTLRDSPPQLDRVVFEIKPRK